ncbi:hypothetical protein TNCV_3735111 [Trichonephila clavipes]|nr:hypothetical protein TNCV_3735111 [Trichonephila clavipes]
MATGSYLTPTYSRSQSEVQGDLHKSSSVIYFRLAFSKCGTHLAQNVCILNSLRTIFRVLFFRYPHGLCYLTHLHSHFVQHDIMHFFMFVFVGFGRASRELSSIGMRPSLNSVASFLKIDM